MRGAACAGLGEAATQCHGNSASMEPLRTVRDASVSN